MNDFERSAGVKTGYRPDPDRTYSPPPPFNPRGVTPHTNSAQAMNNIPSTIETILARVRSGGVTRGELVRDTGFTASAIDQALLKLKKKGLIVGDNGHYRPVTTDARSETHDPTPATVEATAPKPKAPNTEAEPTSPVMSATDHVQLNDLLHVSYLITELMRHLPDDTDIEIVINQRTARIKAFGREFQAMPDEAYNVLEWINSLSQMELTE